MTDSISDGLALQNIGNKQPEAFNLVSADIEQRRQSFARLSAPSWLIKEIQGRPDMINQLESVGSYVPLKLENEGSTARAFKIAFKDIPDDELLSVQEVAYRYFERNSDTFKVFRLEQDGGIVGILTPSDEIPFTDAIAGLNSFTELLSGPDKNNSVVLLSDPREQIGVTRICRNQTVIDSIEPVSLTHISWAEKSWRDGKMDDVLKDTQMLLVTPSQYELMRRNGVVLKDDDVFANEEVFPFETSRQKAKGVNYFVRGLHPEFREITKPGDGQALPDTQNISSDIVANLGPVPNEAFLEKYTSGRPGVDDWVTQLKEKGFVHIESPGGVTVVKVDISGLSRLVADQIVNPHELLRDVLVGFSSETDVFFGEESEFVISIQGDAVLMFLPMNEGDRKDKLHKLTSMLTKSSDNFTGIMEVSAGKTGKKPDVLRNVSGVKVVVVATNEPTGIDFFSGGVVRVTNADLRKNFDYYEKLASKGGFSLTYVGRDADMVDPHEIFEGKRIVEEKSTEPNKRLYRVELVRPLREDIVSREFINASEDVLSEAYLKLHKAIARMPLEILDVANSDIATAKIAYLLNTVTADERRKIIDIFAEKVDAATAAELSELAEELRVKAPTETNYKDDVERVYALLASLTDDIEDSEIV